MPFGVPRHVASISRSSIMTDVVWCTPLCGINYSVSHHDGCRLVHPDMWYQLNAIRQHDGCRLVHPAKWEHFFNAIRHHDGCRLVQPAKWDKSTQYSIYTSKPLQIHLEISIILESLFNTYLSSKPFMILSQKKL